MKYLRRCLIASITLCYLASRVVCFMLLLLPVLICKIFPLKNDILLMKFKSSSKVLCQKTLQTEIKKLLEVGTGANKLNLLELATNGKVEFISRLKAF